MTETVAEIVKDALNEIIVLGAEAPVEAADAQVAIRYLNRMMAALDAKGIELGYTQVSNFADEITTPLGAYEGMVYNLALKLWTQYSDGQPPPPELMMKAKDGMETMAMLGVGIGQTEYGPTVPIGSGNSSHSYNTVEFYDDLQDDILAESTGSIGLESDTASET